MRHTEFDTTPASSDNPATIDYRGLSLWDRLSQPYKRTDYDEHIASIRLEKLFDYLGGRDIEFLTTRCHQSKHQYSDLLKILSEPSPRSAPNRPLKIARQLTLKRLAQRPDEPRSYIPFTDILTCLSSRALNEVRRRVQAWDLTAISENAFIDVETLLLEELSMIAQHALMHEFNLARTTVGQRNDSLLSKLTSTNNPKVYEDFCDQLTHDGGARFFSKYPVLQRLITTRLRFWKRNLASMLGALRNDRALIQQTFGIARNAVVTGIEWKLSDSHHEGQSVAIFSFDSEQKVVFKPRPLELDRGLGRILDHLNAAAGRPLFKAPKVITTRKHGWCEYIHHTQVNSVVEAASYYHRAGALLAVLHVLRGTDCHNENIIASENFPVLIDAETLFHPEYGLYREGGPSDKSTGLWDSVYRVGMLPSPPGPEGAPELSALGSINQTPTGLNRSFSNIGGSLMHFKDTTTVLKSFKNSPSGIQLPSQLIVSELQKGFREGYDLLMHERRELLENPELLQSMKRCSIRFVVRPTRMYALLLRRSLDASALKSGIDRSIEFERLFRVCKDSSVNDAWFAIANQERASLEQLDIPLFTVQANEKILRSNGRRLKGCTFAQSPWALVVSRLHQLSKEDCEQQLRIIELSFGQRVNHQEQKTGGATERLQVHQLRISLPLEERIIAKAEDIASQIAQTAHRGTGGSPTWLTLCPTMSRGEFRMEECGAGLYQGNAGIAFFLGALYAVTGKVRYKQASYAALSPVLSQTVPYPTNSAATWNVGSGIFGTAYVAHRLAGFLGEPALVQSAQDLALSVSDEVLASSEDTDVISGLAGVVCSLEVMCRTNTTPALRKKLQIAAKRIVDCSVSLDADCLAWRTLDGQYLPGFAHGSAGIAMSLWRAAKVLNDRSLSEAAYSGLRNEARLFDPQYANWPDLRSASGGTPAAPSWCHGACGIALSYADQHLVNYPEIYQAHARAHTIIGAALQQPPAVHSLCCGEAGFLEFFISTNQISRQDTLQSELAAYLCGLPTYKFFAESDSQAFLPGLFVGGAGIGYQLLRSVFPQRLPGLLRFD